MGHWNYRAVRHSTIVDDEIVEWYALHEVYYNDAGEPTGMSEEPVTFVGDNVGELVDALEMAQATLRVSPIFNPPEEWSKEDD